MAELPPIEVRYRDGLYLPEVDLWLDPQRPAACSFVSHAHSDHFARHAFTICSGITRKLIHSRYGAIRDDAVLTPSYGQPVDWNEFFLQLLPAGHIFGSAMLHLTRPSDGATLLYTGDFKLRNGLTAEPALIVPAQTLIMETTFGRPRYLFPPREAVLAALLHFVRETLDDGGIPVLLGYSLGKAQEILSALSGAGLPVMLHNSIIKLTDAYRELSHTFTPYEEFDSDRAEGHVLIMPPSAARSQAVRQLKVCRTAMLTGWALDPGAKYRYQVDAIFPLSDHADYAELLRCVELAKPSRVFTVHGFASDFARDLRQRGWEAWSLVGDDQLELKLTAGAETTGESPEGALQESAAADLNRTADPRSFGAWALTCERVAAESSRLNKQEHLAAHLRGLTASDLAHAARWYSGLTDDPTESAGPHGAGWAIIRRSLLELSGLREHEYRALSRSQGDVGRTAFLVLQRAASAGRLRSAESGATIREVAALFPSLRSARGPLEKSAVLKDALAGLSPRDGSYLVRLLTGELRVGSKEGLVEEAIAEAFAEPADLVREAAMLSGDIGRAALLASTHALGQAAPTLFVPIKVMLASPEQSATAIWDRLGGTGPVWLEDKFDGIRAQLHCGPAGPSAGRRAEIYSRDLKCISESFPEILEAARSLSAALILDGEIIAHAPDRKLTFHDLQRRLGRRREVDFFIGSDISVRYVVFDVLWMNGASLLHEPLTVRRQHLDSIPFPEPIQRLEVAVAVSAAEIEAAFHAAHRAGNEGLIAKDRDSLYTPGRRGKTWLKLKKPFGAGESIRHMN